MIDDVYQAALAAMRHHLDEAGATYKMDEGEILLGEHRLGLSITFDRLVTQGEHTLAPLDIQIHLDADSGDRFRVGTLGVGSDRTSAIRAAVAEWHLLAVAPLLAALGATVDTRRSGGQPQQVAGWDLFAGRAGIRGSLPEELSGSQFARALLQAIGAVVTTWQAPKDFELRSIYFMATRSPQGVEVEAAVDGLVSAGLGKRIGALPWPRGSEPYLYKQLFVLRQAPPAQ